MSFAVCIAVHAFAGGCLRHNEMSAQHMCDQSSFYVLSVQQVYADRFELEKVRLHNLLGMDHGGLERLGVHSLGEQDTIINGVYEYLRAYLRAAEPFASGSK